MASAAGDGVVTSLDRLDSGLEALQRRSFDVEIVYNDWRYLRILWESFGKGRHHEIGLKIEATVEEIAQDLICSCDGEKDQIKELEFLFNLARDCGAKTRGLMAEIAEDLDHLYLSWLSGKGSGSSSTSHFQWLSSAAYPDAKFWPSFAQHLKSNLLRQTGTDYLCLRVESISKYMGGVCRSPHFFPSPGGAGAKMDYVVALPGIDACLGHLVSLLLRIAIWCSDCELDSERGGVRLKELEQKIDTENLMEFHLNFLMALYCNSSKHEVGKTFVRKFEDYFVSHHVVPFLKEITGLICHLFASTEQQNKAVIQTFFPETIALVVEIASLKDTRRPGNEDAFNCQRQALNINMALLRAEIYLVQVLHISIGSDNSSTDSSLFRVLSDEYLSPGQMPYNASIFYEKLPNEKREILEKMRSFTDLVFKEIESLYRPLQLNHTQKAAVVVKNTVLKLVFKAMILREESFLMELLLALNSSDPNAADLWACGRDQIRLHLQKLEYFLDILSDERMKDREDVIKDLFQVLLFLRRMTCFSSSSPASQDKTVSTPFHEQLDKASRSMELKLMEISPHQFPVLDFPKTSSMKFLDFQLKNIEKLLTTPDPTIASLLKHKIEEILRHFKSLSSFLINVSELDFEKHAELKDLANRVTQLGYKAEFVVDKWKVGIAEWRDAFLLDIVLEELRQLIDERARGFHLPSLDIVEVEDSTKVVTLQGSLDKLSSGNGIGDGTQPVVVDETLVDLIDQQQLIIHQLTSGLPKALDVVSIVGMPGLGKTTLAREVYNSKKIMSYFNHRAWCSVSQTYDKRELLLQILASIIELTNEICLLSDEDLESKLRQCLLKNKYLIVMDDVWGVGAWNDLKRSFPENTNGSRILLTSRLYGVALEVKPDTIPHPLRPLSEEESWQLLEKKVFKAEACPEELLAIAKEIARLCQGLPLAVVAIAGILKMTEKSQSSWRKIAVTLSSVIIGTPEAGCKEVLELSYQHLPEDLKPCFLYLGVFHEVKDILVSKLIRLWLAEGFIPKVENKIAEDVAEDFLMDLIGRSLVIISTRRSNGKVKSCRLHDLVLDFCKSKGKEENLFQLVTKSSIPYASYPSSEYGFEFVFYHHSQPVVFSSYRLTISLKRDHFLESRPSGPGTRSLVFFASRDSEPKWPYDISFLWHNFSLLKVLDFECFNAVSFPDEIERLVLLRYLAVGGYMRSIPESIANLRKLETLILKGLRGKIILPYTIWNITSLRHLHVKICTTLDLDGKELRGRSVLENLVSLSCLSLSCGEDADRIMKRFPNLRALSCIFFESQDSSAKCNQFPKLSLLSHLESLKILYYGNPLNNGKFNFPLNLKELTLSMFGLPWSRISAIGCLPHLEVLKLLSGAFVGQTWDMFEDEFQKLRFLRLENLDIEEWNASCDHLPKLERLFIQNCKDLKKIPDDFASIDALEMIQVHWCQQSLEESAIEIQKETPEIKVLIRS